MHPSAALPDEQQLRRHLDITGVFNLLTDERLFETLEASLPAHRERRYPPTQTLAMFVAQTLMPDGSCQRVLDQHVAWCIQNGLSVPSTSTGGYCAARRRLPSELLERMALKIGRVASDTARGRWQWRGRRVLLVDGTGVSMPDTEQNQTDFPQPASQREGCGFPLARLSALSCAATGALLDVTLDAAKGKATGESAQLRTLARSLETDDVLVGDAIHENYWSFVLLFAHGCDGVFELNGSRCVPGEFRSRLTLKRPRKPDWMDKASYRASPPEIVVRQSRLRRKGRRDKILISTFVDEALVDEHTIGELYARRWSIETDFRSLKCALEAGILRCTTPTMVRKELFAHLLGYNLVRLMMCEAAIEIGCEPRRLSFSHAAQLCSAFAVFRGRLSPCARRELLRAIGARRVGNRPGRKEPRAIKRRPKPRSLLDLPRPLAREYCHAYERR